MRKIIEKLEAEKEKTSDPMVKEAKSNTIKKLLAYIDKFTSKLIEKYDEYDEQVDKVGEALAEVGYTDSVVKLEDKGVVIQPQEAVEGEYGGPVHGYEMIDCRSQGQSYKEACRFYGRMLNTQSKAGIAALQRRYPEYTSDPDVADYLKICSEEFDRLGKS